VVQYFSFQRLSAGEPDGDIFRGPVNEIFPTHIGPKEPRDAGHINWSENAIPVAPNDTQNHYFWGWSAYYDVFDQPHLTEFCWRLVSTELSTDGKQARFRTRNCEHHNCTDKDCLDYKQTMDFVMVRLKPN